MYDGIATLYGDTITGYDEYGNAVVTRKETQIYVLPRGVYQSEYYNAAQLGLKPSLSLFVFNRLDYNNEKQLLFDGKEYDVIRVDWSAQRDGITLVCEERVRNG